MAPHLYWRLYITASNFATKPDWTEVAEIEMRSNYGGADQCTGGTPSASHNWDTSHNYAKAFDNDPVTYWASGLWSNNGTPTWLKYQFAQAVHIAELAIRAKDTDYKYAPKDFSLQWSDNNTTWTTAGSWTATNWGNGEQRLFQPLRPVVRQASRIRFDLGIFRRQASLTPYQMITTLQVARIHPYWISLGAAAATGFSLRHPRSGQQRHRWYLTLLASSRQPIHDTITQEAIQGWSLRSALQTARIFPTRFTFRVAAALVSKSEALVGNPVRTGWRTGWMLLPDPLPIPITRCLEPDQVILLHRERPLALLAMTLEITAQDPWWRATLTLAHGEELAGLAPEDPVRLTLNGESCHLIVDHLTAGQTAPQSTHWQLTARSPTPRSEPGTWQWEGPVRARSAAETIAGSPILWQLTDWTIEGSPLILEERSPLAALQALVGPVGGVVGSTREGQLWIRRQLPTTPRLWSTLTPDHRFTEALDLLSHTATWPLPTQAPPSARASTPTGWLELRIDPRTTGGNQGRDHFRVGEIVHLQALTARGATVQEGKSSLGTLTDHGSHTFTDTEMVTFDCSQESKTALPATSLNGWQWLGASLGTITLGADGRTLAATTAGTALALIQVTRTARNFRLATPTWDPGMPIRVAVTATRGLSDPVEDPVARLAREQFAADLALNYREHTATVLFRPGLLPGHQVAIASEQGAVQSLQHRWERNHHQGHTTRLSFWTVDPL